MDFNIVGTIELIIAERWYMSTYIYYTIKAQNMHMKLILSVCQNLKKIFRDATAESGNLGISLETRQLLRVNLPTNTLYLNPKQLKKNHMCCHLIMGESQRMQTQ